MKILTHNYNKIIYGFMLGIIFTYLMQYLTKKTHIYNTKRDIVFENNIIIPKNTNIIKHSVMPEGYSTYILYINLDLSEENMLDETIVKGDKIYSYWSTSKSIEK